MNVSCGNCPAKYAVPDEKVRGRKVKITCKRCGAPIVIDGTSAGGPSSTRPGPDSSAPAAPASAPPAGATPPKQASSPPPKRASSRPPKPASSPAPNPAAQPAGRRAAKQTILGLAAPPTGLWTAPATAPRASPATPKPADAALRPAAAKTPEPAPTASPAQRTILGGVQAPPAPGPAEGAGRAKRAGKQTILGGLRAPEGSTAFVGKESASSPAQKPAGPAPEPEWTVAITDDHHEEMDTPEVVKLFAAGTIDAETFIWKEGMDDWLTPLEIPAIADALKARGLGPKAPAPAASIPRPAQPSGVWREPGRWNEPPSSKPIAPRSDVSFDDVTVAMAIPEAEALFRAAEEGESPARSRPGATAYATEEVPDDEPSHEDVTVMRPGLSAYTDEPSHDDVTVMRPGLSAYMDEPSNEDVTVAVASPLLASRAAKSMLHAEASRPAPAATPRPAAGAPRPAAGVPLFAEEPAEPLARSPRESRPPRDDGGEAQLTGARNESSVLFSLDALTKSAAGASASGSANRVRETDLLAPVAPKRRDDAPPDSLANLGAGGLLAAPDFSAPVAEAPPPVAVARAATDGATGPLSQAPAPAKKGRGGLVAAVLLLVLAAGGLATAYVLKVPRSLFPQAQVPPTAEPSASGPATATPEAPSAVAPAATASAASSATPDAGVQGTTPTASAAASTAPGAREPEKAAERPGASGEPAAKTEAAKPEEKPAASAAPPAGAGSSLPPFDRAAAASALGGAAGSAASCKQADGPTGSGRVTVTFAPSGRATNAIVTGDFAGTAVGGCVARIFRSAHVPPFSGDPVTVGKSFSIQ